MGKQFKNKSIYKRMTFMYIIIIFIPSVAVNIFGYGQINRLVRNEFVQSQHLTLQQVKSRYKSRFDIIENVATNIQYNSRMINFLREEYMPRYSYDNYYLNIKPIVEYTYMYNKVNINTIAVFMGEKSIPRGFGFFYHDTDILDQQWLRNFIEADKSSTWIVSDKNFDTYKYFRIDRAYLNVNKIATMQGDYLGLFVMQIKWDDLYKIDEEFLVDGAQVMVITDKGKQIYPYQQKPVIMEAMNDISGDFIYGDQLYVYDTLKGVNAKVVLKAPTRFMHQVSENGRLYTYILFASSILLMVVFYFLFRNIFLKIHKNIDMMNEVIKDGFKKRIPVKRDDELGQISRKFNYLLDKIDWLVEAQIKEHSLHKDTQLKALQYQINPHFIYNTLGIFAGKLELEGLYDLSDGMADFSNMLRYNIKRESPYTTIRNEMEYLKSYMTLQKIKFDDRVKLDLDIPAEIQECMMPVFTLQPIVENSILHGFVDSSNIKECICIKIKAFYEPSSNYIRVEIEDNGKGIEQEKLEQLNYRLRYSCYDTVQDQQSGIGLRNINERLKLFYGEVHYLRVESSPQMGTKFIMVIPKEKKQPTR